ncbi:3-methyl-2-oxobutanoate hydroxymethyltransferase [Afipia sp. P52-10]|uniref:3-methyl-2-oxobutanoate hydroxymethyltransferase n=1 Tax=Afipia sp. P52-10 TaxID=1429916 RepID=UPI0003DEF633|nr:3-methyl-2-oxobutanoate hydroxymethyltransferase [Afipia sp. P52-10]ETR76367.1 3-methyl-2-oxobutanoate hydroxymethyltransferase [Afipia sp. P52-10]
MSTLPLPESREAEIKRNAGGRLTAPDILRRKRSEPLVMLTAYTARMAEILDPHCDLLLVGDSLAQVIYGLPTTLPVSLEMMATHGAAVVRGSKRALVVIDMPFRSYEEGPEQAFRNASWLLQETGAGAVKIEGGIGLAETVSFLKARGIPVMSHIGLTPQSVHTLGGYKVQGRSNEDFSQIMQDAQALDNAGAFAIVVEAVVEALARSVTQAVECPTIGIGASPACDGQVLVVDDMLGMTERVARFVKRYENLSGRIDAAVAAYSQSVRARAFPEPANLY